MTNKLQEFVNATAEWSDATFGENRSPVSILYHLEKEVPELICAIRSKVEADIRMEFADVFILILDAARCAGLDVYTLMQLGTTYYGKDRSITRIQEYVASFRVPKIPASSALAIIKIKIPRLICYIGIFEKGGNETAGVTMINEFAKIFTIVLVTARQLGLNVSDIIDICWVKLEINKKRVWGAPDENGVCEHIKE